MVCSLILCHQCPSAVEYSPPLGQIMRFFLYKKDSLSYFSFVFFYRITFGQTSSSVRSVFGPGPPLPRPTYPLPFFIFSSMPTTSPAPQRSFSVCLCSDSSPLLQPVLRGVPPFISSNPKFLKTQHCSPKDTPPYSGPLLF